MGCLVQGRVRRWGSFSGSEILQAWGNSLLWIITSSKMTQNSLTLVDLLCRVRTHRGYRVAEGCKHKLEAFRKKLSRISLFPPPSSRTWFCSLELVPVSNTHRLSRSLSQPGSFTCGWCWIKGLKSLPYFRFEMCIFCLIWSSPLPSCFQTFFICESQVLNESYPFLVTPLGQEELSPGGTDLFFLWLLGQPKEL